MGYTLTQINTILSKSDRAIHILGSVAYNKKFAELDETYWYDRDIIFLYKTAVEWGKVNDRVGDPRMDFIVERLEAMMEIYDYGSLTPIYSQIAQVTGINTVNFLTEETDPTVPAWVKAITQSDIDNWDDSYGNKITSAVVTGTNTKTLTLNQQDGGTVTASWTDINTDAVSSVFGRTGAVIAQSGDYTTTQVTEGLNLYYTDGRVRNAISESIVGIDYNSTTGVFSTTAGYSIPTSSSQANWDTAYANRITSLTTIGTSGAATLISNVLNIPNYTGALTGYVPYTGATANVDLGEYELKAGQLTLDVSPTGTAAVGTTRWNNTIGSSETTLKGGSVILKNGVDLVARVVNKVTPNTTLTKAAYSAVRISGAQGQRLAVAYAQANNDNNSADTIGLVTETIATNQEGFIMTVGQLEGINTTGSLQGETWADGDVLYLSPSTAGALTNIKPTGATGHIVVMGYVEYAHANNGKIYVKVMNGWELDELHNVYISSVANNQGLFYESSTQLWKNKSIATVLGYTPANAATTLTINGTAYDISANRTWNVGTVTSVATTGPLTGGTITGSGTIGITQATTSTDGYLSSTDWNTFNSKQAALTFSAPLINTSGTISIPAASASVNGYLSSTDWATFNNKQAALSGTGFVKISGTTISYDNSTYYLASNPSSFITLTALSATAPLSYSNTTGVFSISQATTSTDGYLSSTDWNTFNNKQAAGNYITALTGEATASGPGSASVTLSTSAVTGKLLTGLNLTGGGTIAATDSILQAFGKVQNQISGLAGGVTYQGTWNASTNTPTLTSSVGTKGYYYIVDVAGSTNLNGITDWKIGDWAIFNGSTWDKVDNTDAVSSVNGFTGAVSLTTSNIAEGTNLYYLDSRARLALSFTAGSGAYDNTTGVITIPTNTSQLTNGANFITLSSLSASSPLAYNSGSGAFSIQVATGSQNGYLSSTDWTTFNSKQPAGNYVTTDTTQTITALKTFTAKVVINTGGTDDQIQLVGTAPSVRLTNAATGATINGFVAMSGGANNYIQGSVSGDMTIGNQNNGKILFGFGSGTATQKMSLDSSGNAVLGGGLTLGSTLSNGTYTYTLPGATGTLALTSQIPSNPVGGTGTTNYVSKFTASSTIGSSQIWDNGTSVLIGTTGSLPGIKVGIYSSTQRALEVVSTNANALFVQSPAAFIMSISNGTWITQFTNTGRLDLAGDLLVNTIANATTDTDRFLVSDSGVIKYRTGAELLSDIGGQPSGTYVTSVGLSSATSGVTIGSTPITTSGTITLAIATASGSQQGLLSSTDWTTFNNKQNALTNPVTGTGTTNYLPKFTGTSTIGNSGIYQSGNYIGIGTTSPIISLQVRDSGNTYSGHFSGNDQVNGVAIGTLSSNVAIIQGYTRTFSAINDIVIQPSGGNLGLGVSPSAWGTLATAFDIGTGGASLSYNFSETNLATNVYRINTGASLYKQNGIAMLYSQSSGGHAWQIAPSGTAGNAISFTQAMTLTANSRLLIGFTGEVSADRLQVSGNVRASGYIYANDGTREVYLNPSADFGNGALPTLQVSTNHALQFATNNTLRLTIASTGAATFSSSVTAGGNITGTTAIFNGFAINQNPISSGTGATFTRYLNSGNDVYIGIENSASSFFGASAYASVFYMGSTNLEMFWSGAKRVTITNSGAATFSSSVTATTGLTVGSLGSGSDAVITLATNASGSPRTIYYKASTATINFTGTGGTDLMTLTNGGSLGIGTTSPISSLMVSKTLASNQTYLTLDNKTNSKYNWGIDWAVLDSTNVPVAAIRAIYPADNDISLGFYTYNGSGNVSERMRITSGGNVAIGGTSALGKLTSYTQTAGTPSVWASSNFSGDLSYPSIRVDKYDNNSSTSQVFINFSTANNTTANGQINGNGSGAVAFGSWSDIRLKENIENLSSQLANIMALRPVEFDYIQSEGGGKQIGFIAQEMQNIYPDAVGKRVDGMLTVTGWSKTEARLVKAIQELKQELDTLKNK